MNYRSLLVHLDDHERCPQRIDVAVQLARRFEAHLVGLAPTGSLPLMAYAGVGAMDAQLLGLAQASLREAAQGRAALFTRRCHDSGLHASEAVVDVGDAGDSIVRHGRCSDLVVIGQAEPGGPGHRAAQAVVEQAVLQGARPTLLMPTAGRFDTVGEQVLVAWDDSREAARAIADAMPLLCRAREVQVLQFGPPLDDGHAAARERLEALRRWLAWHGVEAGVRLELTGIDFGNALLSHAADQSADLIVMGAYGHARWSERVLGGVTRTLLSNMTVPVLMSH